MSAADKLKELAKMLGAPSGARSQAASTLPEKIDTPVISPIASWLYSMTLVEATGS